MIGTSLLLAIVFASQATAATFTATEGAPFSGTLATASCTVNTPTPTPTINWGDGTSSPASFTSGAPAPLSGTHTYLEEGTYTGSVRWADDCHPNGTTASLQMDVADALLSSSGTSLTGQAGTPIVARVASLQRQGSERHHERLHRDDQLGRWDDVADGDDNDQCVRQRIRGQRHPHLRTCGVIYDHHYDKRRRWRDYHGQREGHGQSNSDPSRHRRKPGVWSDWRWHQRNDHG